MKMKCWNETDKISPFWAFVPRKKFLLLKTKMAVLWRGHILSIKRFPQWTSISFLGLGTSLLNTVGLENLIAKSFSHSQVWYIELMTVQICIVTKNVNCEKKNELVIVSSCCTKWISDCLFTYWPLITDLYWFVVSLSLFTLSLSPVHKMLAVSSWYPLKQPLQYEFLAVSD